MQDNDYINLDIHLQNLLTPEQAWHYSIIPGEVNNGSLELFISESKKNENIKEELEMLTGKKVSLISKPDTVIQQTLGRYYRRTRKSETIANYSQTRSEDFIGDWIKEADSIGSSDIHVEAYEKKGRVRLRVDGKLVERYIIDKANYPSVINKIKIMANLDIAEKRLPQDGRINFQSGSNRFDIRVSVLPTLHGEKVVLRLLSKDATSINLTNLGFSEDQLQQYITAIKKPHGIILISGPTGSGKTTTLYGTLKELNSENTNILTIEDPIEYTLPGINQVQLKESIGLTFASALRTFLRQDPDIIMLGEIRDQETAQMAIRAALTGHLVLSTIHTNSAWGTISRLLDMDIPPFLLTETLNLAVAQRLVRLLCPSCKKEAPYHENMLPHVMKLPGKLTSHFVHEGCNECYYTGYKGRTAIYELIPVDSKISGMIKSGVADPAEIYQVQHTRILGESAFQLLKEGLTTIEEIYSILMNY